MKCLFRLLSRWAWSDELSELKYWRSQLDAEPTGVLLVPLVDGGLGVPLRTYNLALLKPKTNTEGK